MNSAQRILRNIVYLLTGNILSGLFTFASMVYIARVLGPFDFGRINFAIVIVLYFNLAATTGLPIYGTREIAKDRSKLQFFASNIVFLRLFLSFSSILLLLSIIFLTGSLSDDIYLIMLYGLGLIPSALLIDWIFQGLERMAYISLGRILSTSVNFLLLIFIVKSSKEILLVPLSHLISQSIASLVLLYVYSKKISKINFSISLNAWKNLFVKSLPIGISLIMIQIFYSIDTIMLGFLRSNEEIGYYNAAYKIIMLFITCIGAYHAAIFPLISRYYVTSIKSMEIILQHTTKLMCTLAFPVVFGGLVLAGHAINFIYGTQYVNAIIPFQILTLSVLIIFINTAYSRGLLACKKERWYLLGTAIPAFVNIAINLVLIPRLGMNGAAIATVLAELSGFIIMYYGFKKIICIPFLRYTVKPLISSIAMAFLLIYVDSNMSSNFFVMIAIAIMFYLSFMLLIKGITIDELKFLHNVIYGDKHENSAS